MRVQPGAKRDALLGRLASGEWKVSVCAPPLEGRANEALIALLAGLLGVKARQVTVARGAASRAKGIEIAGLDDAQAEARLGAQLRGGGR